MVLRITQLLSDRNNCSDIVAYEYYIKIFI